MGTQKVQAVAGRQPSTLRKDNATLTWLGRVQDERGKLIRWAMLLKRFSFNVNHSPEKNNELTKALSRQPGDEVFIEDPVEAEAFLPPERIEPEGSEFLACLNTEELHRRIVEAKSIDLLLREAKRKQMVYQLREGQDLRCQDA
jgi:hypothetical protein